MTQRNRQWILRRRPEGRLRRSDFELRLDPDQPRQLRDGEVRFRNIAFRCSPTMRNWMQAPGVGLYPSMPVGSPVLAPAAGVIVESANPAYAVGDRYQEVMAGWQDVSTLTGDAFKFAVQIPHDTTYLDSMGRYGLNAMTAYFGLLDVGRPQRGETLVVSAAAGSTGSVAAQLGRIHGLKVLGIAGGHAKCRWLTSDCGLDAAVDYKTESVVERLRELAPQGIDVFYDNVGDTMLQAAVANMARFGRIVLCGQIAGYDEADHQAAPLDMMRLVYGSIRMEGFLFGNYAARAPEAMAALKAWTESGELVHREHVHHDFEDLPAALMSLFEGSNDGTVLVASHAAAAGTDVP